MSNRRVLLRRIPFLFLLAATALCAHGCEEVEQIVDERRDLTPHEAYAASLRDAGLDGTALGRAWRSAAAEAVEAPIRIEPPFREQGWLTPESPAAAGYRMRLERGQVLTVQVELEEAVGGADGAPSSPTRLFVDFFRVPDDPADPLRPVQTADSLGPGRFSYEPWRDGAYVLRIQPELLRGGRYRVTLSLDPALAFPVEGRDTRAIQSFFGAPRDGGVRDHHGVDIFAPRGTPALAAADGRVSRANETPRGGRVVWLRDARRSQSLYYAHLDSQAVRRGQEVRVGDTLGFVGNTGNARTTPPHLHFGIYQRGRGPVDPMTYLRPVRRPMPELGDAERLGSWVRNGSEGTRLRSSPGTGSPVAAELAALTPLRVLGATAEWWRVRLPDGRRGYVASRLTEPLERPVAERTARAGDSVWAGPGPDSPVVVDLVEGTPLAVLGRFGGFDLVETTDGATARRRGWMAAASSPP